MRLVNYLKKSFRKAGNCLAVQSAGWRGCQSDMLDICKAIATSPHSLAGSEYGGLETIIGVGPKASTLDRSNIYSISRQRESPERQL